MISLVRRRDARRKIRQLLSPILILCVAPSLVLGQNQTGSSISDERLTEAIETHLILDERVAGHRVDVETKEGVVTLRGSVDNILAKHYALQLAGRTRGVRSAVNLIEVNAPEIENDQLHKDVAQALRDDPATERYEVSVAATDGVITLDGTVQSNAERYLAEFAAAGVRGVREVRNELKVETPKSRPDSEIKEEIQRKLDASAWVNGSLVEIDVENGHVTLSGLVATVAEHLDMRKSAWVDGVRSLKHSELQVNSFLPGELKRRRRVADLGEKEIKAAVEDALKWDPRVSGTAIATSVQGHEVSLRGTVRSLGAKRAAEDDAWHTFGVTAVKNQIRVRPPTFPTDVSIEAQIERMLSVDPYVNRFDVHVSVRNSHAYLHGTVDTNFEKLRTEEVASRARGVVYVTNRLKVDANAPVKADEQIEEDIKTRFLWDVFVEREDIEVEVDDGVATLSGAVDSFRERGAAQDILEAGATRVVNRLTVEE